MPEIDNIVSVTIETTSAQPSAPNFGVPLILAFHTETTDLVNYYASLSEAEDDGFEDGLIHDALSRAFAAVPRPEQVAIGRLTTGNTMTVKLTPVVANATVYSGKINDLAWTFTSDADATAAEIVAGIVAAINGVAGIAAVATASATDTNSKVQIVSDTAGLLFTLTEIDYDLFTVQNITPDTALETQLAAIQAESDGWFAVCPLSWGEPEIKAIANFCETNKKHGFFVSADSDIISAATTDLASDLVGLAIAKSNLIFTKTPHDFKNVALASLLLPLDPGSYTAKFKTLSGCTADTLSSTELSRLLTKRCNNYVTIAGISMLQEGVCPKSGIFIDFAIFIEWLTSDIQTRVYTLKVNSKKVAFTQQGITAIAAAVQGSLDQGVVFGGFDPTTIKVTPPKLGAVTTTDKGNRLLRNVAFEGVYTSAIHKTTVRGNVT